MVQIIVLAAVAFFLFWRLKSVLGSRQGFENSKWAVRGGQQDFGKNYMGSNMMAGGQ